MRETIPHIMRQQALANAGRVIHYSLENGEWRPMTWAQAQEHVEAVAAGLDDHGCRHGDSVAIMGRTCWQWTVADGAILLFGGVTIGIYETSTPDQVAYIINHSESRVLFVAAGQPAERAMAAWKTCPGLELVIVWGGALPAGAPGRVDSWDALLQQGRRLTAVNPQTADRLLAQVQPDDVATLVYTSGTTGPPKGVVLTHANLAFVARASNEVLPIGPDDVGIVFLPLAHSLQRVTLYAGLVGGLLGYFAPSLDALPETWKVARPTIMASVPRIFEKVHARIENTLAAAPPHRQALFRFAMKIARHRAALVRAGKPVPLPLQVLHRCFDSLVFSRIRAVFGGRVRYMVSGGAPIGVELLEFFHALGILILEGYGLTETSGPATVNGFDAFKLGTVGRAMPGTELRISEIGEILIRGTGVFREYFKDPEATAAAFAGAGPDRWFRSGDVGDLDADGFLRITDRIKDLIITAGGKNIAPQNIENLVKSRSPLISHVVVHGDRRNYLVALIALHEDELLGWAERHGLAGDYPALCRSEALRQHLEGAISEANRDLARYEQIKKFAVLEQDLTQDGGELTPSLKVKRRVVESRNRAVIESMYA
ncbi:MAG: long-chain fatty acid--CoA ligase [Candidatus Schekmanbacteria bacterium]|nr:long-chain fatty acid--CoA ligase [Candidatus Schekmanbacteria bacterium]